MVYIMSNLNRMLKQAQKMQQDVQRAQDELADLELSYSTNGVSVTAKGDYSIKEIVVNEELFSSGDKELFEDVILVAVNGAISKIREETETRMSGITGGLNLPGIL